VNSIVSTLIPVASVGVGFFLIYVAWKSYSSTRNISNWEVTQGTITKSNVKPAGVAFIPDIEYQYFVVGVEYKGTVVTVPPDIIYDVKVAQGLIEEYPVGKKVEVFYNPEIHRVAVLEKESSTSVLWVLWLIVGTALAFLIFGFAFLFQ
jgi:hypothetical protein